MASDIAELLLVHDERALVEAERRYGAYLRFLSESITRDARDAEECVNDAFFALWRAENVNSPAAFLTETVRRLSYKRVRSEKTQKRSGEARMMTVNESERACEIADRREPWDELEAGELRGALSDFFDSLSPENRLIFVRRHLYSDSYAEIGGMLGVSENVVSVRLVRIRERLRRQLIEKGMIGADKFERRRGEMKEIKYTGGGLGALYIPLPCDYSGLLEFSKQGLAGVNRADGKVGFIDELGRVRIPFIYSMPENDDDAPSFGSEGLASVVNGDGKLGFIDTEGNTVIPFEFDGSAYSYFINGVAAVCRDGERIMIDTRGERVHDKYEEIERDGEFYNVIPTDGGELVAVLRGGKFGAVDADGKTVIPFIYDRGDDYDLYYRYFSDGLIKLTRGGKYCFGGFVGGEWREVIPPLEYKLAHSFWGGYAPVAVSGTGGADLPADPSEDALAAAARERGSLRYGLIDTGGRCVIPPVYTSVRGIPEVREGAYLLDNAGEYSLFESGRVSVILREVNEKYDHVWHKYGGWFGVSKGNGEGIIDIYGREAIPPKYDSADPSLSLDGTPEKTVIIVRKNGKFGITMPFCEPPASAFIFDSLSHVRGDLFFAKKDGAPGILRIEDAKKLTVSERKLAPGRSYTTCPVEGRFDSIDMFCDGLADAANHDGSVCFIDHAGRVAIPIKYKTPVEKCKFDDGETAYMYDVDNCFSCGLACVSDGEKLGYIKRDGEVAIPFIYDDANPFINGRAEVTLGGERMCIDADGEIVFRFSDIERDPNPGEELLLWEGDLICVIRGGKLGYVDIHGNTVVPFIYDDPWVSGYPSFPQEGLIAVCRGGRPGYVDLSGSEVIPAELPYDLATGFHGGFAVVGVRGADGEAWRYGLIDRAGREAVPPMYDSIHIMYGVPGVYLGVNGDRAVIIDGAAGCRIAGEIRGSSIRPRGKYVGAICGGRKALFDLSGKMILPPKYERVIPKESFAVVSDGDKWGVVGLPGGGIIIPLVYDSISPAFDEEGYSIARSGDDSFVIHID